VRLHWQSGLLAGAQGRLRTDMRATTGTRAAADGALLTDNRTIAGRHGCWSGLLVCTLAWTARTAAVAHRDRRAEEGNRAFSRPHRRGQEGSQDRAPQAVLTFLAQSSAASGADWPASLGVEPSPFRSKEHTAARESSPWKALWPLPSHCSAALCDPTLTVSKHGQAREPCRPFGRLVPWRMGWTVLQMTLCCS